MKQQMFVAQPHEDMRGSYVVARWNFTKEEYESLKHEVYLTLKEAQDRARELNEDYIEDASQEFVDNSIQ